MIWMSEGTPLYFDNHETVRFRIEKEHWFDQSPVGPKEKEEGLVVKQSPYVIEASMEDPGLGPVLWWDGRDEEQEEEEEA